MVGHDCCLDKNDNKICDKDETNEPVDTSKKEEIKEEPEEIKETPEETKINESKEEAENTEDNDTTWCEEIDPDAKIKEQTINGKKVKMCCAHYDTYSLRITSSSTRCYSKDGTMELRDDIEIRNDGTQSTRTREEKWEEYDKICKRVTDENGEVKEEGCKPKTVN